MKCIYCLKDKGPDLFSKEHVIPESFGVFRNNFTLIKIVCKDCNKYFGDNLEIALARDTLEGGLRFSYKVKDPKDFRTLGQKSRLVFKVAEGEFKGAYFYREYSEEKMKIIGKPLPQVAFLKKSDKQYDYFLIEDVPEKELLEQKGYDLNSPQAIIILSENHKEVIEQLEGKGIKFKVGGIIEPANKDKDSFLWECECEGLVDATILRAVAKIAFNYLAFWNETIFMLNPSFDPTRRFIRFGERPGYALTEISEDPILGDEPVVGTRRLGHILTVNWADDQKSIVARVGLFNRMTYAVCLAKDFQGERREIRRGHFFSPHNQQIIELAAGSII